MSSLFTVKPGGGGGSGITTINGNVGHVSGTTVTFTGGTSGAVFTGDNATTMTESFNFLSLPDTTTSSVGYISIGGEPFIHGYPGVADSNTFVGAFSGNFTNTGSENTAVGANSLESVTTAESTCSFGFDSLNVLESGNYNTAIGTQALLQLVSGAFNTAVGPQAGINLAGSESNNIYIASQGVAAESRTMRLGVGSADLDPTKTFIAGIAGNSPGGGDQVVYVNTSTGQMSSAASAGGSVTINGDAGTPISGSTLTFTGGTSGAVFTGDGVTTMTESFNFLALPETTSSSVGYVSIGATPFMHAFGANTDNNTFLGFGAGNFTLTSGTATDNTGIGHQALSSLTTGAVNTAIGNDAGSSIDAGSQNVAVGQVALVGCTSGNQNSAFGTNALDNVITGSNNIGVGFATGNAFSGAESNNILIGSVGVSGESNALRIGILNDISDVTTAFIGGIAGNTPGAGDQVVYVNTSTGQVSAASFLALPETTSSSVGYISLGGVIYFHAFGQDSDDNLFVGNGAGNFTLVSGTASGNTGVGAFALSGLTTGFANAAFGVNAGAGITGGVQNVAVGNGALALGTSDNNTAVGQDSLSSITTGVENTALGIVSGAAYSSSESFNICIGSPGINGESNALHIGDLNGQPTTVAYISGIAGNTPGASDQIVYVNTSTQQLSSASSSSTLITTYNVVGGVDTTATWTKNARTKTVTAIAWAAGNGGGSGRQGLTTASSGGGGGSPGAAYYMTAPASFFGATETVHIGAGAAGGVAQAGANTDGNAGSVGGASGIGNILTPQGTSGGGGGTVTGAAGTSGLSRSNYAISITSVGGGPGGNGAGANGQVVTEIGVGATGGGGGSGANSASAQQAGNGAAVPALNGGTALVAAAAGGISSGTINGAAGGNQLTTGGVLTGGAGGGGGGGMVAGTAGTGGKGGFPGGGGGGGGGSLNGTNSGAGGAGGDGLVIIIEQF
jgi:hypothetical protein